MRLPNKLFNYEESILSKFVDVIDNCKEQDVSLYQLYKKVKNRVDGIDEFIEIMDCLYLLDYIEYDLDEGVIKNVKTN